MKIIIIKYNAGNIQSVLFALERIGAEATVTDNPDLIRSADKVIFPGVGEASSAMEYLRNRKLDILISELKQPVLGVCLGMQLLCRHSEENDTVCMGVFSQTVKKFVPSAKAALVEDVLLEGSLLKETLKVPQMGWNNIYDLKSDLFKALPENTYCYFVHGYYAGLGETTIAKADYVEPYSSALHKNNFYGVQFHPEKSATAGEQILKNFIQL